MTSRLTRIKTFVNKNNQKTFDIEANLRSWGLIGHQAIQREESRATQLMSFVRKKIFWHRLRLLILWLLVLKLFYSCSLPNHHYLVYYFGDVSGFMGIPKLEMGLMMALWTLPGPILISQFIRYKNTKRMQSWVRIYDMFDNNVVEGFNHNILQKTFNDNQIRRKFRKRITKTKVLFRCLMSGALISGCGSIVMALLYRWPQEYRQSFISYFWSIVSVLWIYLNQKSIKSCLIIFNQICYYITLRFRKVDLNLKHLLANWDKYNKTNNRRLVSLLREHDVISELTFNCNKFWTLFIITNTAIKIPLLLLVIHTTLFYELSFPGRLVSTFMMASIFLYTTLIYYSAAQVEYESRRSYQILNSFSMKRMSVQIQYKLLNTIQKISTHNIGFDIYAVHTITYLRYFEMIIAAAFGFLMVIGLKFNEMQKLYVK